MSAGAALSVLESLGFALFERVDDRLMLVGPAPSWAPVRDGRLDADTDPFLEAFVADAVHWWSAPQADRLRSGPWQVGAEGASVHLEASALWRDGNAWLLLQKLGDDFALLTDLLQTQRDAVLAEARAGRERDRRDVALHCILHDLKNPLTAVRGAISLLREEPLSDEALPLVEMADSNVNRQIELLREVLEVYSAEAAAAAGATPERGDAPSAGSSLRAIVEAAKPAFEVEDKRLALNLDASLESVKIVASASRFRRVIDNLLDNARRFSPAGGQVTLGAERAGEDALVWVDDEGPGVPEAEAPFIFDRLRQGMAQTSLGSIGLGLYFARITVEGWGGIIGHAPRDDGGTRFWVRLRTWESSTPNEPMAPLVASVFHGIVGQSPQILEVRRRIGLAAQTPVTVLLTGESGTGKELAARALHYIGPRSRQPLVSLNCGAVAESLIESELFGHVRGAFTGANRERSGVFVQADGGTLFLDEVEAVSHAFQVKLLRTLETGIVRKVGAERDTKVDVRLIAATNRPLAQLVADGSMREDFYYRLRVFEIELPPLRDRPGDIPLLVTALVANLAKQYGKRVDEVSPEVLACLCAQRWPGNVRQLRNALEHAVVALSGDRMLPEHLPADVVRPRSAPNRTTDERQQILAALRRTDGNRTAAAEILGYSRVTLWKKLGKLDIDVEAELAKPGDTLS